MKFCGPIGPEVLLSPSIDSNVVQKMPTPFESKFNSRHLQVYFARYREVNANVSGHLTRFFSRRLDRGLLLRRTAFDFFMIDPL